ncbi:MAG TPA: hypothetical protein VF857_01235 [Spirochaetota bacterium]
MSRFFRTILSLLVVISCASVFAQDKQSSTDKTNPLYDPVSVVLRLSYDNFKNIKILYTAVVNYGGGQAEFDRLVDGYAEASALYFSHDYRKAADAFTKNEKDIRDTAVKLAAKYRIDAEALNKATISHNVKLRIRYSLDGKKSTDAMVTAEKLINQSSESLAKGYDFDDRVRPVQAIQLFRRSKEQSIQYYQVLGVKELDGQKLSDRFERENADNRNKIYVAKEKKN